MSKGLYGVRKDIKGLYGPKASAEYLRDVAKSRATPKSTGKDKASRLIKSSDKPSIVRGDYGDKNLRTNRFTTPANKRDAERRLRKISKDAAKRYTQKVAKENAKKAKKSLSKLSRMAKGSRLGISLEVGIQYMKSKNQQRKLVKGFNELRSQNLKKG